MNQLLLSRRAVDDLERLVDFLVQAGDPNATDIVSIIEDGLLILRRHPLVGRPAEHGLRDHETEDAVVVLAIRHQRETGREP